MDISTETHGYGNIPIFVYDKWGYACRNKQVCAYINWNRSFFLFFRGENLNRDHLQSLRLRENPTGTVNDKLSKLRYDQFKFN